MKPVEEDLKIKEGASPPEKDSEEWDASSFESKPGE